MPSREIYVIYCRDKPGMAQLRTEHLSEHRQYLADQPLRILLAGPVLTTDRSLSIGSFIFVEAASLKAAVAFYENDPFFRLGLWERIELHPFDVARHGYATD